MDSFWNCHSSTPQARDLRSGGNLRSAYVRLWTNYLNQLLSVVRAEPIVAIHTSRDYWCTWVCRMWRIIMPLKPKRCEGESSGATRTVGHLG